MYSNFPFLPVNSVSAGKRTSVYGIGINDANYVVNPSVDGVKFTCPIYRMWVAMFKRCYSGSSLSLRPSYVGCTVDERWHSFMAFREWVLAQPEWEGRQLDKDLLAENNKVYGPDTCIFITHRLNSFLATSHSNNSGLPIGVKKFRKKFVAHSTNLDGSRWESFPVFTMDEAYSLYLKHKRTVGLVLASEHVDSRIVHAVEKKYIDTFLF